MPSPRCADAEAYELSQGELSNGIFVSFLKRWLLEDEKITVLLDKVAEGEFIWMANAAQLTVPHRSWTPCRARGVSPTLLVSCRHGNLRDHQGQAGAGATEQLV